MPRKTVNNNARASATFFEQLRYNFVSSFLFLSLFFLMDHFSIQENESPDIRLKFGKETLEIDSWAGKQQYDCFCQVSLFTNLCDDFVLIKINKTPCFSFSNLASWLRDEFTSCAK